MPSSATRENLPGWAARVRVTDQPDLVDDSRFAVIRVIDRERRR